MAKGKDAQKTNKKKPVKTLKEKRKEKKEKKAKKWQGLILKRFKDKEQLQVSANHKTRALG